ncbi:TolC family outer membrane protein [Sphingomonas morindae]|uniref:TolC family outer membrane protein n=1 Tax=Sphingomonas morindae TaxID=1541170 RepID=A0ABY4X703_9SPHN|nr:TolC family outer membrane protein [Sphingomonas morindae]USI72687.1 TolC family outer membrane protein [Sphingomonas morindae]
MTRGAGGKAALALALACGVAWPGAASALTLRETLDAAYGNNPQLNGQRAALRATDAQYGIVRAQGLPSLGVQGSLSQNARNYSQLNGYNRIVSVGAQLSVPVWQGGRVRNALNAADARVAGGQQGLRATEGDVFVQAVTAYMDVLRDRAIVKLNLNNVRVLQTNLDATRDRFQVGDLTRTDVAQSEARLEGARSQLSAAQAQLTTSEENFRAVIGQSAGTLDSPPDLPMLPAGADQAEATALRENPNIAAAAAAVKAARYDVGAARATRLPIVSATASENYYNYAGAASGLVPRRGDYGVVGVTATIPLYQGGGPSAQVRQSQAFESQALEQQIATERQVVANVHAAFSNYQALLATERSSREQVRANALALEGLRAEQSVGLRQVLDVLNGEQELLSSNVTLVSAQHDAYIAGFQLLNAMGLVNYKRLGLNGGPLYDPNVHYESVRHTISDFKEEPTPAALSKPIYGPAVPEQNSPVTPPGN